MASGEYEYDSIYPTVPAYIVLRFCALATLLTGIGLVAAYLGAHLAAALGWTGVVLQAVTLPLLAVSFILEWRG
jgi:hypothetical protein